MKMTSRVWLTGMGIVLAGAAFGALTSDNFDTGYSNGGAITGNQWGSSGGVIATNDVTHWSSLFAAKLPVSSSLSNTVGYTGGKTIWTDFYTIPRLYVSDTSMGPAADPNATAQFFLNSNGLWGAICGTGNGGITTNYYTNAVFGACVTNTEVGSNWVHISVLHNYGKTNWSLFVNGYAVATNLPFINAQPTNFNWFAMQNGGGNPAWLDDIMFTNGIPRSLIADGDTNSLNDAWEMMYLGSLGNLATGTNSAGIPYGAFSLKLTDPSGSISGPYAMALPFSDYFEAAASNKSLYGANGWDASPSNQVMVTAGSDNVGFGIGQAVKLSGGQARHDFFYAGAKDLASNVWTHLVLKPIPGSPAATNVLASENSGTSSVPTVSFYVDGSGTVMANSNATYVALSNYVLGSQAPFKVDSNKWYRFITKSDYAKGTWSLYVGDAGVGAGRTNAYAALLGDNLAFNQSATNGFYSGLSVSNVAGQPVTGYLDSVQIALDKTDFIDANNDGIPDTFAQTILGTNAVTDYSPAAVSNRLIAYAFGATNATISDMTPINNTGTTNILMAFVVGPNRTYHVFGSSTPNGTPTPVGSFDTGPNGQTNTLVDTVSSVTGSNRYFYRLVSASPDGSVVATDTVTYAWYSQTRQISNTYWVTIPVDYGTNNALNGRLGRDLARGLGASGDSKRADEIQFPIGGTNFASFTLASDGWYTENGSPSIATNRIPRGTAIMVMRHGIAADGPITIFAGQAQTNSLDVTLAEGWNMIGWPYDDTTYNSGLTNGTINGSTNSDTIYFRRGLTYKHYTIKTNGWWSPDRQSITNITPMQPGEGVMYRHFGGDIHWTPAKP